MTVGRCDFLLNRFPFEVTFVHFRGCKSILQLSKLDTKIKSSWVCRGPWLPWTVQDLHTVHYTFLLFAPEWCLGITGGLPSIICTLPCVATKTNKTRQNTNGNTMVLTIFDKHVTILDLFWAKETSPPTFWQREV